MFQALRLVTGVVLATVGILTVVPPSRFVSPASAVVIEFGYCMAAIAILALLPGWSRSRAGRFGAVFNLAAAILLATPVVKAMQTSNDLPGLFAARFGTAERLRARFADESRPAALVPTDLFAPPSSPPVRYEQRTFKDRNGQDLTVDIYHPSYPHGPIPGVIVIHGEGWQTGEGAELVALNGYLAARDHVVAAISDPRIFQSPFPAGRDSVISTVAYLKAYAQDFGLDATRLVILGRSVGGHLALVTAYALRDPAIRGAVSLYAPTDLTRWYSSAGHNGRFDTRRQLERYFGGPPARVAESYEAASPVSFVSRESPPTLLIHGVRDEVVPLEQSERLAARLDRDGVRHLVVRLPWAMHGCDRNFAGPCGQITTYAVERFLNAVMVGPAASPTVPVKRASYHRAKATKVPLRRPPASD